MPLSTPSLFPPGRIEFAKFNSRRSVVHSTKGIVACTQPLAAKCGLDILNAGGNAAVSPYLSYNPLDRSQELTQRPKGRRRRRWYVSVLTLTALFSSSPEKKQDARGKGR